MINVVDMKQAYQEKADAQLREWQDRIQQFQAESNELQDKAKPEKQRCFERLEDCQRIARVRLDELRTAQGDRWEMAKQAVERAMIELKRVMDESGVSYSGSVVQLQSSRPHHYPLFQRKG